MFWKKTQKQFVRFIWPLRMKLDWEYESEIYPDLTFKLNKVRDGVEIHLGYELCLEHPPMRGVWYSDGEWNCRAHKIEYDARCGWKVWCKEDFVEVDSDDMVRDAINDQLENGWFLYLNSGFMINIARRFKIERVMPPAVSAILHTQAEVGGLSSI